jgi:hypothetical protein
MPYFAVPFVFAGTSTRGTPLPTSRNLSTGFRSFVGSIFGSSAGICANDAISP